MLALILTIPLLSVYGCGSLMSDLLRIKGDCLLILMIVSS